MEQLNDKEMLAINGGSTLGALGVSLLITAGITFTIGILDGILRPLRCK